MRFAVAIIAIFIGSCDTPDSTSSCSQAFDKVLTPDYIDGHKHLYVSIDELDFLSNPGLVLDSVTLNATFKGKVNGKDDAVLSMNGRKMDRQDGQPMADSLTYEVSGDDTLGNYPIYKMFLNGAEPFKFFLLDLKARHGTLELSLDGGGVWVTSAKVEFKGTTYTTCQNATPTPTPVPPLPVPNTTITSETPSAALTNSSSISIAFSSDISGSNFLCSLDGAAAATCTSPQAYSNLSSAAHSFAVYATNANGVAGNTATYNWTVNTVPPTITLTSTPPALTNANSASFGFTSNDAVSYSCAIDGGTASDCTTQTYSISGLADGPHSFAVTGTDSLGNVSSPVTYSWTIDTTAPTTTIVSVTPSAALSNDATKAFTFAADESATFQCSVDNGAYANCTSPFSLSGLADGQHWFNVKATDVAGNTGVAAGYAWTVDTTAPVISLDAVSPAQGLTNINTLSVNFSTNEPSTVYCSFDGASATACTSPFAAATVSDGAHSLALYAVDVVGNQSAATTVQWSVDTTAPNLTWGNISPAGAYINVNSISLAVLNSDVTATLNATLNGSSLGTVTSPISLTALAEGSYTVSVTSTDSAGNVSSPISYSFNVDQTPPTVAITASVTANPTTSDSNSFTLTPSEAVSSFECQLDNDGWGACTSPYAASGLAYGAHTFLARATDLAGNVGPSASYSWTIAPPPPTTVITSPNTQIGSTKSTSISFSFSSPSTYTVSFVCSLDGAAAAPCTSPTSYSGLADGTHTFVVKAVDSFGQTDPTGASYTWKVDTTPPVISGIVRSSGSNSITISWSTNEAATGQLRYGVGTNLNQLSAVTGFSTSQSIRVTGLTSRTTYSVQIISTDAAGNVTTSSTFTVTTTF